MIYSILTNKCPNCRKGLIYKDKNIHFNFSTNRMNNKCDNCGFKFEKEPGFFFGAMYVSYILGIVEAVIVFIICRLFYESVFDVSIIVWISLAIILLSSFNMRVSRIIWIYSMRKL